MEISKRDASYLLSALNDVIRKDQEQLDYMVRDRDQYFYDYIKSCHNERRDLAMRLKDFMNNNDTKDI